MRTLIAIILTLFMLTGCRSQFVDITEADNIHDTCFITRIVHDSIEVHDSTFCHIYEQGDTVFRTLEKWHTKYKEVAKHDTVYISKIDTITKTIMQKEQRTPWYKQLFDDILLILFMAIGITILLFSLFYRK